VRLRRNAGRLDPLIDDCDDWFNPPVTGTYLVACDPRALRAYVESGLENTREAAVRVEDGDPVAPEMGATDLPAVRRKANGATLESHRIATIKKASVRVFASCRARDALLTVTFRRVTVTPDEPLRIDDSLEKAWRLRRPDGTTVATARPRIKHGTLGETPRRCSAVEP
jgi:hypothetical protein